MNAQHITYSKINFKSRQCVTIQGEIEINTNLKTVWNAITEAGHLKKIHPYCKSHHSTQWNAVGCKDSGMFYSGIKLFREIIAYKEHEFYTVKVTHKNNLETFVTFTVQEITAKKIKLSITINSNSYKRIPRPLWFVFVGQKVHKFLRFYLYSLLSGTAFYSETGIAVTRNQFGHLTKLSPKQVT
jgi:hypothetical protein